MTWIVPKIKPKLTEPRKFIAHKLVVLARKIYPRSEEVYSFYASLVCDQMITGKSIIRIDPMEVHGE